MASQCAPRNFVNPNAACILLTEETQIALLEQDHLSPMQALPRIVVSQQKKAPWRVSPLSDLFAKPDKRQLIIYSETLDAFETALCLMALESGFQTYFVCPEPDNLSASATRRLWQTSTVVLSDAQVCRELELHSA